MGYMDTLLDWLLNTPMPQLQTWFSQNPENLSHEELSVLKDTLVQNWMMATGQEARPVDEAGKVIVPLPVDPGIHVQPTRRSGEDI